MARLSEISIEISAEPFQIHGFFLLGGELPTNREWVSSPQFFEWINPTYPMQITGVITHLLSGMSHQVDNTDSCVNLQTCLRSSFTENSCMSQEYFPRIHPNISQFWLLPIAYCYIPKYAIVGTQSLEIHEVNCWYHSRQICKISKTRYQWYQGSFSKSPPSHVRSRQASEDTVSPIFTRPGAPRQDVDSWRLNGGDIQLIYHKDDIMISH